MSGSAEEFVVSCACGVLLTGPRLDKPQIISCPGCAQANFVLPHSPWSDLFQRLAPPSALSTRGKFVSRDLLLPFAASALALALLVLAYRLWLMPSLVPADPESAQVPGALPGTYVERLANGRKFLEEGSFRLALEAMSGVPGGADLTQDQQRDWQQTRRQAAVLADLLSEPLEDVIRHAAGIREQGWQAEFRHRFVDRSIVLDAEFQKAPDGKWEVGYPLYHGHELARMNVDNVKILALVSGNDPQRLVLGMRLASIKLELPGPAWVVRFHSDSGVFLTNAAAAAHVCPPLAEPEALLTFKRQEQWLE